ncbi:MAG: hypothetical protein GX893_05465 [Firmicutes bacterium]|nr:hypothetical protein [Bacillota bacterium]
MIAATGLKSEEALKQSKVIDELLNQIHKLENN